MNILFITPSLPTRLHRIRAYHLIKYLSRNHNVHLLSLAWDKENNPDFKELKKFCSFTKIIYKSKIQGLKDTLLSALSLNPLEVSYCKSNKMEKTVKYIVNKFNIDLIYIKRLRAAQFAQDLKTPIILDSTDAMSLYYNKALKTVEWYKKPLFFEEWMKYSLYEKRMAKKIKKWIVCSQIDKSYLENKAPVNAEICLVPNGIDTSYFHPFDSIPEKHSILFSGLMDKHVNIDACLFFVKEVFPIIKKLVPCVKLYLVGPNPVIKIRRFHDMKNIIVTGFVPDLRQYIAKCSLVVSPVRVGTGTRNKILQAWAMQKPVISTSCGAQGLDCCDKKNIFIRDNPVRFAENVMQLLNNEHLLKKISRNGYKLVKEKYDMNIILKELEKVIKETIESHEK